MAIKGDDATLTWRYSLSADEQTKSDTYFFIAWGKFNRSTSNYDRIALRVKTVGQNPLYDEPSAPHIVIDRATGTSFASLQINDVVIDDGGIYKIQISVVFPGTAFIAEQEVNVTVLGKFNFPPFILFIIVLNLSLFRVFVTLFVMVSHY